MACVCGVLSDSMKKEMEFLSVSGKKLKELSGALWRLAVQVVRLDVFLSKGRYLRSQENY